MESKTVPVKCCKACKAEKPESDFPPYKAGRWSGRRNTCYVCWNAKWTPIIVAHSNRYYHESESFRKKALARAHAQHLGNKAGHNKSNSDYAIRYPERNTAKVKVMMAVRSGALVPCKCHCGRKAHAHHDNYEKPLDVIWLCPTHHGERHRIKNRTGKWPKTGKRGRISDETWGLKQFPERTR